MFYFRIQAINTSKIRDALTNKEELLKLKSQISFDCVELCEGPVMSIAVSSDITTVAVCTPQQLHVKMQDSQQSADILVFGCQWKKLAWLFNERCVHLNNLHF